MQAAEQLVRFDQACVRAHGHFGLCLGIVETVGADQRQSVIVPVLARLTQPDSAFKVEKRLREFALLGHDPAAQIPCRVVEGIGSQRILQRRLRMAQFRQPAGLIRKPRIECNGLLNSLRRGGQHSISKPRFRIVRRNLDSMCQDLFGFGRVDRRESAHRPHRIGFDL